MCGIVGAVTERRVRNILLEGLQRLEYRGYDSAGMATMESGKEILRNRQIGKVANLVAEVADLDLNGTTGIAHTRWLLMARSLLKIHTPICPEMI